MLKINKDFKPVYEGISVPLFNEVDVQPLHILKTEIVDDKVLITYKDENGAQNIAHIPLASMVEVSKDVNTYVDDISYDVENFRFWGSFDSIIK